MMNMESILMEKKRYDFRVGSVRDIILPLIIGFFLARGNVLDKLTPFGFAFLSAYIIMKDNNPLILLSVILGTLTFQGFGGLPYILTYLCVYGFFKMSNKEKEYSLIKSSLIATGIFTTIKIVILLLFKPIFIYDIFLASFEGVLIFTMTYIFSFSIPIEKIKGSIFNNEKIICTFITLGLVLSGFNNMVVFDISLKNILSIIIILYLSYNEGAFIGGTTGIILGMIAYISHPEMPFIIGIFGITGLLAGVFRDLGLIGSILGFVLGNGIISYYINGLGTSFLGYKEIILAVSLFLISAERLNPIIKNAIAMDLGCKKDYAERKDEIIMKKLNKTADLFNKLASTFRESVEERDYNLSTEVYSLVDGVVNNSCMECDNYKKCWEENYYTSYNNFFNLISLMEIRSSDDESIYLEAEKFCSKSKEVIEKVDRSMEKLKLNHDWNLKLQDNRILLSEQLEAAGKVIKDMANDIYENPEFNKEIEDNLYKDLKNDRLDVKEISVINLGEENLEVFIDFNSASISEKRVKEIISNSLGFPVVENSGIGVFEKDNRRFKLIRKNRFSAMTNMARLSNSEDKVTGDSFTFGEIENTHFSALSDGMGIGRRANQESKIAISLLERLMEANVDKDLTLKTINSVLRVKSNEEIFTTLDLSFIDLYSGKLQMIKTGSPATFIKKKDRIEVINTRSLPVGILKDVDFNIYEEYIEDGDIIIMMSDGILEASRDIEDAEEWMKNIIIDIDSGNPQIIAEEILSEAKEVVTGSRDDMTVLVTKVWKNI